MRTRSLTPARIGLFLLVLAFCAPLAFAQMPQPNRPKPLSSSEVSDKQLKKVARIAVTAQMSTRKMQIKKRREMKRKYGKGQQMDSTQKAKARREMMKHRRKMQKKRMKVMKREAKKEGMDTKMVRRILMSIRKDSTLQKRFRKAAKAEMQKRMKQKRMKKGGGSPNQ